MANHKNELFEIRQAFAGLWEVEARFDASAVTVTEWPIAAPGAREDQEDAPTAQYSIPGTHAPEVLKTLVTYCTQ